MWPGPLPLCSTPLLCVLTCAFPQVESSRFLKIPQDSSRFPFRTSTWAVRGGSGPWAPLVFCFLFFLPACPALTAGPSRLREIKNAPPWMRCRC